MKADVLIEAQVHPTEDPRKVENAIKNFFEGKLIHEQSAGRSNIRGNNDKIDSLFKLKELIKKDRIRDAARQILLSSIERTSLIFYLNKQVAYVNHISFCNPEGESPLGPIRVEVDSEDPYGVVEWLTEKKL